MGPDGQLSFSRIWGVVFGTIVIGAYVYSFFKGTQMPSQTIPLLAVAMAPYVTKQGGDTLVKVLALYKRR